MPPPYQLLAAHPALDFINTLDNRFSDTAPTKLLPSYNDLLAFVEDTSLVSSMLVTGLRKDGETASALRAVAEARALRETLASVFYAVARKQQLTSDSLRALSLTVIDAQSQQALVYSKPGRSVSTPQVRWRFADSATSLKIPVWAIALNASELLTSDRLERVRECSSPTCRWLFLDTTKNHSRRWCDMAICGNREKARQFSARRKAAGTRP